MNENPVYIVMADQNSYRKLAVLNIKMFTRGRNGRTEK